MDITLIALFMVLGLLLNSTALWIAAKIVKAEFTFQQAVIASAATTAVSLTPGVGWILSFAVLFFIIKQFSDVNIWPDAILMVLISRIITLVITLGLFGAPI